MDDLVQQYKDRIDSELMSAGSWKAIKHEMGDVFYELCHVLDELMHAVELDNYSWARRFCHWAHRRG